MKCMDSDKKVSETQSNKNEVDRKAKHTIPFQTFLVFHPSMSRKSFIARGNAKLYLILSILVVRGIMPLDAIGDTDIDVPLHIFWRSKELPGSAKSVTLSAQKTSASQNYSLCPKVQCNATPEYATESFVLHISGAMKQPVQNIIHRLTSFPHFPPNYSNKTGKQIGNKGEQRKTASDKDVGNRKTNVVKVLKGRTIYPLWSTKPRITTIFKHCHECCIIFFIANLDNAIALATPSNSSRKSAPRRVFPLAEELRDGVANALIFPSVSRPVLSFVSSKRSPSFAVRFNRNVVLHAPVDEIPAAHISLAINPGSTAYDADLLNEYSPRLRGIPLLWILQYTAPIPIESGAIFDYHSLTANQSKKKNALIDCQEKLNHVAENYVHVSIINFPRW
uniref:Glyco_tran_10_N domain-containing protein n=1 Tax=Ascaris lumbricoides TaxID=6252 RepID=A0A0M3HNT1_ASCLU